MAISTDRSNAETRDEPSTLSSRAFEQIKDDIISGELAQGTKIVESDLALKHGISRGPLREAIHRLERIKLIVRVPHAGSRVIKLDARMMQDIYTAREALEGMAARLAARLMPEADVEELIALLDKHEASIDEHEGKAYFQSEGDIDFHYRIAVASQNQWILDHLNGELYQLLRMGRHRSGKIPSRARHALRQHRQIAQAIAERDEELAELLMRRHISSAREIVSQLLEENP